MKTIWFVSHASTLPQYAMRTRTNNFAKYLAKYGYKVEVFTSSKIHNTDINLIEDKKTLFISNEIDGVIYNSIRTSNYKGNGLKRIINFIQFPMRFYRVAKKKENKPDIIINNPQSLLGLIQYHVSRKVKARFITEVRDLWPESIVAYKGVSRKNIIIKILYFFEKWIYKRADSIIFTIEGGKEYIIDKKWDKEIDISKIHYLNNGVDLDSFNYNKEHYQLEDGDLDNPELFNVIYTGSIRRANNVKKIVDVAEQVNKTGKKDIKFLIYGEGPDKQILEQHCIDNNIDNVIFKGYVDKKNIPYILSVSDLNILHFEQSGLKKYGASLNKLFEYFASEKPTISDCEFGYDLIKRYNCGVVIDDSSPQQLAEEIVRISLMPTDEYNQLCSNSMRAAQDYDFKLLTEKLIDIIEEV